MAKTPPGDVSANTIARALAPPVAETRDAGLTADVAKALAAPLAEEIAKRLRIQLLAGDDALLTPAEAREFLRRSDSTLEFWRSVGIGPRFVRLGARGIAYRLGDLRAYIAETSRGPARPTDIEIADTAA
jgi:hypothetical protein